MTSLLMLILVTWLEVGLVHFLHYEVTLFLAPSMLSSLEGSHYTHTSLRAEPLCQLLGILLRGEILSSYVFI